MTESCRQVRGKDRPASELSPELSAENFQELRRSDGASAVKRKRIVELPECSENISCPLSSVGKNRNLGGTTKRPFVSKMR
jgi:hypothetical protein